MPTIRPWPGPANKAANARVELLYSHGDWKSPPAACVGSVGTRVILCGTQAMIEKKTPVMSRLQAALLACVAGAAAPAMAQNTAPPTPPEVDQAFRDVVANAGSVEARTKYANLLVRSGNFEGGIAALEGLLLAPDAPASIRFELGVLYFRLGSYAISERYLRVAIDDAKLEPALKLQAEALLREVVKRNQASQLSGSLTLGVRQQSNPTSATDNAQVYYLGLAVPRGANAGPQSDTDTYFWGKLDHVLDLDKQNEASIVTSLVAFADHYNSVGSYAQTAGYSKPFDLAILAGSTGIRFKPMAPVDFTLRPNLIFGSAMANGNAYFNNLGLGLDGNYRASDVLSWNGGYENTKLTFSDRGDMVNSPLQGGTRRTLHAGASWETTPGQFLITELAYTDHDGNASFTGYRGPQARMSYLFNYAAPFGAGNLPWTTTVSASVVRKDFRGADPSVDALTVRSDQEWRWSLVNNIPFTRDLALHLQLDYSNTASNISNFSNTNTSASLGVTWKY